MYGRAHEIVTIKKSVMDSSAAKLKFKAMLPMARKMLSSS